MIVPGEGQRYVVSEMYGVPIRNYMGRGGAAPTYDYAVLDSHYCYREIVGNWLRDVDGSKTRRKREHRAYRACDLLNAAERVGA